jgi:hypothetical protein
VPKYITVDDFSLNNDAVAKKTPRAIETAYGAGHSGHQMI